MSKHEAVLATKKSAMRVLVGATNIGVDLGNLRKDGIEIPVEISPYSRPEKVFPESAV
jgi:hypothetical protein